MVKWWCERKIWRQLWVSASLAIATTLLVVIIGLPKLAAQQSLSPSSFSLLSQSSPSAPNLPPPRIHPLPASLAQWQAQDRTEDYFAQIESTSLGYLIWSKFPIKVYLEQPKNLQDNSASNLHFQQWVDAVREAIAEWNIYLPLTEVAEAELADMTIARSSPSREIKLNRETGLYDIGRATTARTSYEFYLQEDNPPILSHRMRVEIDPSLSQQSILAAARHELGHALGIWGHSPQQTDALYFSQVRDSSAISSRDINTLKKIYQQPTRLGWAIINDQ
ncbi:peptidase [Pleurocapsales cyanobacterium LEGE 06147]|nr:peptidase [Pleurocapsales cyanobacterium LEGE 06147]